MTYWFFFLKTYYKVDAWKKLLDHFNQCSKTTINTFLNYTITVFYIVALSYKLNKTLQLSLINVSSTILTRKENYNCFIVMEKYSAKHFVILQWLKQAGRLKPGGLRIANLEKNKQVFLVDSQWPQNMLPPCCTGRFGMVGSFQLIICQTFVSATKPLWQED